MVKNYYDVLGVAPTAEEIVIRAAYRALAQRYHPDRNASDLVEAERRMVEINEAYGVLSDPAARTKFDKNCGFKEKNEYRTESNNSPTNELDSIYADEWAIACEIYPDLNNLEKQLKSLNSKFALGFRILLIETKRFKERILIFTKFENDFFDLYFGLNKDVHKVARTLIFRGHRQAAADLNRYVITLGSDLDLNAVINVIEKKHSIRIYATEGRVEKTINYNAVRRNEETGSIDNKDEFHAGTVLIYLFAIFIPIGLFVSCGKL